MYAGDNISSGTLYKSGGSVAPWDLALTASDSPSSLLDCTGGALLWQPITPIALMGGLTGPEVHGPPGSSMAAGAHDLGGGGPRKS